MTSAERFRQLIEAARKHAADPDAAAAHGFLTATVRLPDDGDRVPRMAVDECTRRGAAFEADAPVETHVRSNPKVGRNDPCPCGGGRKYKKCCMNKT